MTVNSEYTRGRVKQPTKNTEQIITIICFIFSANVTGQRTRHLVAGTLDPIVGCDVSWFIGVHEFTYEIPLFFSAGFGY